MSPSKARLRASILKSIEDDHRRELKASAGPVDKDFVAYRRRRCRGMGHFLLKDIQCFTGTPDDGRWFIECRLAHPDDAQATDGIFMYVSRRMDPAVLQDLRDRMLARKLQAQHLLPSSLELHSQGTRQVPNAYAPVRTLGPVRSSPQSPYSGRSSWSGSVSSRHSKRAPGGSVSAALPGVRSGADYIEITDSESEPESSVKRHQRSIPRSPSVELLPMPPSSQTLTVWLFSKAFDPPVTVHLQALRGGDSIAFRDYDSQWESLGLKISERVKVLAGSSKGEYLWQSGRLCDVSVPASTPAIVLASIDVDQYHRRIETLVKNACLGSFTRGQ
ncbi:unnamed protein product [Peniophora sp. CBMAI 1063]|nr:unnamed protein product [Peniophora sp. CBMAI 1063]